MKKLLIVLAILVTPALASAQTATSIQKFAWDQTGPSLADVQAYTYNYYDGNQAGKILTGVTCVLLNATTSTFTCEAPIPAFTPGNHSVTLTASNAAGESAKSGPLAFVFVVTPAAPTNLRLK